MSFLFDNFNYIYLVLVKKNDAKSFFYNFYEQIREFSTENIFGWVLDEFIKKFNHFKMKFEREFIKTWWNFQHFWMKFIQFHTFRQV